MSGPDRRLSSSPPDDAEAPSSFPPFAGGRSSRSTAELRVNAGGREVGHGATTPVYSERKHRRGEDGGFFGSSRVRISLVLLVIFVLAVWLWTHPIHFGDSRSGSYDYNALSGLRPEDLQALSAQAAANKHASLQTLNLAAIEAGRPTPLGVSFQCPAPQPCPVPLCPDASGTMVPAVTDLAHCPPAPKCEPTTSAALDCPTCPAVPTCPPTPHCKEAKCDAGSCASVCAESSKAAGGLGLPAYMTPRLQALASSSQRLFPAKDDAAHQGSDFDLASHEVTWQYCASGLQLKEHRSTDADGLALCPETARNEWYWQLSWFERTDAKNKTGAKISRQAAVHTPLCAQLPPRGYIFPSKYPPLPQLPSLGQPMSKTPSGKVDANEKSHGEFHWKNLRMKQITDMLDFNSATPKNLYHFDAPNYDVQQHHFLKEVAPYIPFEQKVRLMLDVGAGGASLGLLLKRLYDVQTVSTVFADWPYCEYITERGGLCMLLDAMIAFPFAKFSYDVVHSSWIFHGMYPKDLFTVFQEQNRVLRPGGYLWWVGGWSREQMQAIQSYAKALGYVELYSDVKPVVNADKPGAWRFGTKADIPYQVDWTVVWVKPIRAVEGKC